MTFCVVMVTERHGVGREHGSARECVHVPCSESEVGEGREFLADVEMKLDQSGGVYLSMKVKLTAGPELLCSGICGRCIEACFGAWYWYAFLVTLLSD